MIVGTHFPVNLSKDTQPELFIKNVDSLFNKSNIHHLHYYSRKSLPENHLNISVFNMFSIHHRHFLPNGRADLTVSASLRPGLGWVGSWWETTTSWADASRRPNLTTKLTSTRE
jgi:hypothetical protein